MVVEVVVVIKGVNKVLYRHHDRAHRKKGDYRDLGMAKTIRIDLERFKATLCLRGDDVTEPFFLAIIIPLIYYFSLSGSGALSRCSLPLACISLFVCVFT